MTSTPDLPGLDTSVVLRLLLGEPAAEARAAQRFVAEVAARGGVCVISDLVIAEAFFALRTHYRVDAPRAAAALHLLATDPAMQVSVAARDTLAAVVAESTGAGFIDRLIHAAYAAQSAQFTTFDRQAGKLSGSLTLTARA